MPIKDVLGFCLFDLFGRCEQVSEKPLITLNNFGLEKKRFMGSILYMPMTLKDFILLHEN
tara:strand:- start:505 stop:684 length:180 start_codon:yes stop_codon:yes gene_type:complete